MVMTMIAKVTSFLLKHSQSRRPEENTLVGMIEDHMKDSGLTVKTSEYEVLLSYPRIEEGPRNYITFIDNANGNADDIITDGNGNLVKSAEVEEILAPSQDNPNQKLMILFISQIGSYQGHQNPLTVQIKNSFMAHESLKNEFVC